MSEQFSRNNLVGTILSDHNWIPFNLTSGLSDFNPDEPFECSQGELLEDEHQAVLQRITNNRAPLLTRFDDILSPKVKIRFQRSTYHTFPVEPKF